MVKAHLPNVLTYFKHRITNAGSEAINTVVQTRLLNLHPRPRLDDRCTSTDVLD